MRLKSEIPMPLIVEKYDSNLINTTGGISKVSYQLDELSQNCIYYPHIPVLHCIHHVEGN